MPIQKTSSKLPKICCLINEYKSIVIDYFLTGEKRQTDEDELIKIVGSAENLVGQVKMNYFFKVVFNKA